MGSEMCIRDSLNGAQFDADTNFSAATLRGAALSFVDLTNVPQIADHLDEIFGDATVMLPEGIDRPARLNIEHKDWNAFNTAWRAFQRSIGQDPDDPK